MRNFYKVLGVARKADDQRIKTAFRRRAKAVHPDLNPGNRRCEARFIELMQAYEVLGDTKTRAAYDAYLAEQRSLSRWRFVHCAGLSMTSFVLTATAAILVMSLAGADVPLRESWRMAVAAVAPANATASPGTAGGSADSGWSPRVTASAPPVSTAPSSERVAGVDGSRSVSDDASKGDARPQPASKAQTARNRHVASKETRPAAAKRRPESVPAPTAALEESWPPAPPSDEPRYGLGASDLR